MKKIITIVILFVIIIFTFACAKIEKKPYGAEDIDYEKIEEINKDGPKATAEHFENKPPMADKVIVENGPWHNDNNVEKVEPTADYDETANDGAVPIYEPEHR